MVKDLNKNERNIFQTSVNNICVYIAAKVTFQLSINLQIYSCFVFIFPFAPFEISPKYAFIRQILHAPGW